MIFEASRFVFTPPPLVSRARRILIKPNAICSQPYPMTTSREMLNLIIEGIKDISDADILILEGTPTGDPIYPVYQALGYDFPRVLMLDVKDCIWVEVENPLPHPNAIATFWVPNVVISSDYLISVTPFSSGMFSITNLLSLLPVNKYKRDISGDCSALTELGMDKVIADLYFTLPFDLGIVDVSHKFISDAGQQRGQIEEYGKIIAGEPYEVDREAAQIGGTGNEYLELIETGKAELETWG